MKLKTWLLITYFIVMLLPLLMAYILFAWIQSYNDDVKVAEHVETLSKIQAVAVNLRTPELYHPKNADRKKLEQLSDNNVVIELYHRDGFLLYSSNTAMKHHDPPLNKETLYSDLFALKQGYQSFVYKEPVFDNSEIVGFFQVRVLRHEWNEAVVNRSAIVIGLFIILFFVLYALIAFLVNRKVNARLAGLMEEMTRFAEGKEVIETETNQDEIGKLKQHFYAMRRQILAAQDAIEKEQREKEYMIATLSHDLKTPLTSIQAYAEALLAERKLTEKERQEYGEIIVDKAKFMKQMIDDLLTYTLLQSPAYEMELVEVDGMEFFEMLLSGYEQICNEKQIDFKTVCNVDGTFQVNPKQMIRVVDNLMSNAIHHTEPEMRIWLAALTDTSLLKDWLFQFVCEDFSFEQGYAYIIVQNEGPGISEQALRHVFDPLYQADEARSKKEARGTGLGLNIAKQIIERHAGDIFIFSKQTIGTCVICRIPQTT